MLGILSGAGETTHLGSSYGEMRWGLPELEAARRDPPKLILDPSGRFARDPPAIEGNQYLAVVFQGLDALVGERYVPVRITGSKAQAFIRR
jgi:hypothetical protein